MSRAVAGIAAVVLAGVLAFALAGCSVWGPEGGPGGAGLAAPDSSPSAAPVDAVLGSDGVQRVEVTAGDDLRFTPSQVRAVPGVIEFVFRNTGTTPHAVAVEVGADGPVTGNLNGGQSQTVRVTVDNPGEYPFPCAYHLSSGMRGTLTVTAPH